MASYGRNLEFRVHLEQPFDVCVICECSLFKSDDFVPFLDGLAHHSCEVFLGIQKELAKESG